jgi:glycosyltransferase involved in cell wall biosynthesis
MVEAVASGKPVVALGRGGACEIVPEKGGVLYDAATEESLARALDAFERLEPDISGAWLRRHSRMFSEEQFLDRMEAFLSTSPTRLSSAAAYAAL